MSPFSEKDMNTPLSGNKKTWADVIAKTVSPSPSAPDMSSIGNADTSSPPDYNSATTGDHASSFMAAFSQRFGDERATPNAFQNSTGSYAPPGTKHVDVNESQDSMETVKTGSVEDFQNDEYSPMNDETRTSNGAVIAAGSSNVFSCVVNSCYTVASTFGYGARKLAEVSAEAVTKIKKEREGTENYSALIDTEEEPIVATI